uniref:Polyprotein n=1 Tax=Fern benyvirus TaxID=2933169 RepID=A0A9C7GWH9_9VIRU|nr:polyprotein [Fern benyvirus]CAI5383875.1 polyprotein [Fern benyvirus]
MCVVIGPPNRENFVVNSRYKALRCISQVSGGMATSSSSEFSGFTALELVQFWDDDGDRQVYERFINRFGERLSDSALFAIAWKRDCYKQWVAEVMNLVGKRRNLTRSHVAGLRRGLARFAGPIWISALKTVICRFIRHLQQSEVDLHNIYVTQPIGVDVGLFHVDVTSGMISVLELYKFLSLMEQLQEGHCLVGAEVTAAHMQSTARAVEAVAIAAADASEGYRVEKASTYHIPMNMKPRDKRILEAVLGTKPIYDMRDRVNHDHTPMAAIRHLIRQEHNMALRLVSHNPRTGEKWADADLETMLESRGSELKTLVVSSSAREANEYGLCGNVHHYFADVDSKDMIRTTEIYLNEVVKQKRKNFKAHERKLYKTVTERGYIASMQLDEAMSVLETVKRQTKGSLPGFSAVKRVVNYETLLHEVAVLRNLPGHFRCEIRDHVKTGDPNDHFTQLVIQDSGYNWSSFNWLELFKRTGALVARGYMCLPLELLFKDMPLNEMYKMRFWTEGLLGVMRNDGVAAATPMDMSHRDSFGAVLEDGAFKIQFAAITYQTSNGYGHPVHCWDTLLRSPVIEHKSFDFALEVQIDVRIGPMVSYTISKTTRQVALYRDIALPENLQYLVVYDLPKMAQDIKANRSLVYHKPYPTFTVNALEFYDVVNYGLSLAAASLKKEFIATYVKCKMSGVALVSAEISKKWLLSPYDFHRFVEAAYYYIIYLRTLSNDDIPSAAYYEVDWKTKLLKLLAGGLDLLVSPVRWLFSWMYSEKILENIVTVPAWSEFQKAVPKYLPNRRNRDKSMFERGHFEADNTDFGPHMDLTNKFLCSTSLLPDGWTMDEWLATDENLQMVNVAIKEKAKKEQSGEKGCSFGVEHGDGLTISESLPENALDAVADYTNSLRTRTLETDVDLVEELGKFQKLYANTTGCGFCKVVLPQVGKQIIDCHCKQDSSHAFTVSLADLNALKEKMREEAKNAPGGLAKTLTDAMEKIPTEGFSHKCRVEYIRGGAGTGKSRIIRTLAHPTFDLVVAPFQKLRVDYKDQPGPDGELTTWDFHTQHMAMHKMERAKVFVDEFTALDYNLLAIILYRCAAEVVYLVGDTQQTGILEGANEGVPIVSKIDFNTVSMHVPMGNFRCPQLDVKRINYNYGTCMFPMSSVVDGLRTGPLDALQEAVTSSGYTLIHFSHETANNLLARNCRDDKTTVRANQGSTHKKVVLPICKTDKWLTSEPSLRLVAMSRHTEELLVLHEGFAKGNMELHVERFMGPLLNLPPGIEKEDYMLKFFFGDEKPVGSLAYNESTMMHVFKDCVRKSGAYGGEPAGVDKGSDQGHSGDADTELPGDLLGRFKELGGGGIAHADPVCLDTGLVKTLELVSGEKDVVNMLWKVEGTLTNKQFSTVHTACQTAYGGTSINRYWGNKWTRNFTEALMQMVGAHTAASLLLLKCLSRSVSAWRLLCSVFRILGKQMQQAITACYTMYNRKLMRKRLSPAITMPLLGKEKVIDIELGTFKVSPELETPVLEDVPGEDVKFGDFPPKHINLNKAVISEVSQASPLAKRLNNCLAVAIADQESVGLNSIHAIMENSKVRKQYQQWLNSDRPSSNDDVQMFASGLNIAIEIRGVSEDKGVKHNWVYTYNLSASGEPCVLHHQSAGLGHYEAHRHYGCGRKPLKSKFGPEFSVPLANRVDQTTTAIGIIETPGEVSEAFADNYGLRQPFVDYATQFVPKVYYPGVVQKLTPFEEFLPTLRMKPMFDVYKLLKVYDLQSNLDYDLPYLNHEMSNIIGSTFVSGELNMEIVCPTNQRRNVQLAETKFRALSTGAALVYSQKNQWQTLQTMQARYLMTKAGGFPAERQRKIAKTIAGLFVSECITPNTLRQIQPENLFAIANRGLKDMRTKNYEKQMDELFTKNARINRFEQKDIEKPLKDSRVDLGKAGQGILAWSKEAHVLFMLAFRAINDLLLNSLNPNVVYDNSLSETDFLAKVNSAMAQTPDCATNAVIDATACDSGQNGFTQLIEEEIYLALGINSDMLAWYFMFRRKYTILSRYVYAMAEWIKTSGEPGTLLGNTILIGAKQNAIVRGKGPFCLVCKGDDAFKRQAGQYINYELLGDIKASCPMDFKIDIDVPITFCGYALVGGRLYPNVARKLQKLSAHRFRDFEHFAEYQISLRDWLSKLPVWPETYNEFLCVNAKILGKNTEDIERMVMELQSFSHIGPQQFNSEFREVHVRFDVPTCDLLDLSPAERKVVLPTTLVPEDMHYRKFHNKMKFLK